MKHALCGSQNHSGLHPHPSSSESSLAACLGGNITSLLGWDSWPRVALVTGDSVLWGEALVSFIAKVEAILEVGELLMRL